MSIPLPLTLELIDFYQAAWEEGFIAGQDHGNLQWKYPPMDIAWLLEMKHRADIFPPLTPEQDAQVQAWMDSKYPERIVR